jgi:PA14 domain
MPTNTLSTTFETNLASAAIAPASGSSLSTSDPTLQITGRASSASPMIGNGTGLLGQYYQGKNFETFKFERTDATVNFDWADGAPAQSMAADCFAVRWSGQLQAGYSETYTFYTTSDDGIRLWVNGEQVIDNWVNHAATENIGRITLEAGKKYDIKLEYYEHSGNAVSTLMWSSDSQIKEVIPQSQFYIPIGGGNGLQGDYYNGINFDTLKLSRTDGTVNFDWGTGSPASVVNAEQFSARWTGQVQPTYSETYTFYTNADDGVRLWVNGQQLVNNWTNQAPTEKQGSITLEAGKKYDIKLEYYDNTNGAVSQLKWSSPHQQKQVIPQDQLFSPPIQLLNSKPAIMVPGQQTAIAGTNLPIAGISITDVDAGNGQMTVTLSATNGALTVNGSINGGVTMANIKNNGTGSVVLVGTLLQISATLANPAALSYINNAGFTGTDTIQVTVNDNGNSGSGGAQIDTRSLSVKVSNLNDPSDLTTIGMNLSGVNDWSTEWPFVDVFKTSRPWLSQKEGAGWGQGGDLKLTPEGWVASLAPGQFAETIMMTGKTFPAGQYTLLYDGEGKMDFRLGSAKIISQSPGKMIVDVKPSDTGEFLRILETNPNNPIRNIRFIMPGFENKYQTQPFHPLFLERLKDFKTLRFMDWESTNNSDLQNWAQRTTPNSATQAGVNGASLEYQIQLANTLKINPWFTIPAKASDDYIRQFATMVRDRLDPSLKANIEYSNETWNSMFSQSSYVSQKGLALGLDSNGYTAGLRYYSQRSVEMFNIWESVFGSSTSQRVIKVLSGHAANPWTGEQILGWKDAYKHADSYAIAPYFDGYGDADGDGWSDINDSDNVNNVLKMTADQIVDGFFKEMSTEIKKMFDGNYAIATQRFGLDLVAYEGGQHLTSYQFGSHEAELTKLFTEVNRNPRMRDVYKLYLEQWQTSGGKLFNQFTDVAPSSKWGHWGALEYQNQDLNTAPKYLGLIDFIKANP